MQNHSGREFHISRTSREKYGVDTALFKLSGNVIFSSVRAARHLVQSINKERGAKAGPEEILKAGDMVAMGLIDEILHYVVELYRNQRVRDALTKALAMLDEEIGREGVDRTLTFFTVHFPPLSVYRNEASVPQYLAGRTGASPNREIAIEEILLLWLANMNPAFRSFRELFDDTSLKENTDYLRLIHSLRRFFDVEPSFGPEDQNLIDMLRSPAIAVPNSLEGQLAYIRDHWGLLVRERYSARLLRSLDLFQEERKLTFAGPGPSVVYTYEIVEGESEYEQFSPDREWMPQLVLMAKNVYVWFDQLSRAYGQPVTRLDDIPDDELDRLRDYGFTGLWLIGIWERSPASQRIKQLCGNPEAVPSAYSVFDYEIATDLGGEDAYRNLRERLTARGIRLASDMVPNHFGIDSRYVIDHPSWFISLDHNPFPWYSFQGTDLSGNGRVGIFLEDHYYDRTDAAVAFKRVDRMTGREHFVYHGNDGTSMPWNDTAQLDYLNPDVREGMIELILSVARKFPIIRFDAAMTLTKRHYQRLWYPDPGRGGAIPTRAENGMTKEEFDDRMPQEFWRQVVDRVAQEAPDTLLLAEAFWLLEGYFVRTLGMHRVYNSAFMNILRDEENAKYRLVMKNTLEFDPEVMRRFVNFMNNPDERTAVDQFGKGDKYFGICTMMVTLPGLPMFGHGQVEGFSEKYGMEYRKAYWHEQPDPELVDRHRREIFPLLHRRHLFAGVANFLLYDFVSEDGTVNEDVFAYSNRYGRERTLVLYHNRFAAARGYVKTSVAYSIATGTADGRELVRKDLAEGLALTALEGFFTLFHDHRRGLWFVRDNRTLADKGLHVELQAYDYYTFVELAEVKDNEWHRFQRLSDYLGDGGTVDLDAATTEMLSRDFSDGTRSLLPDILSALNAASHGAGARQRPVVDDSATWPREKMIGLVLVGNHLYGLQADADDIAFRAFRLIGAAALVLRQAADLFAEKVNGGEVFASAPGLVCNDDNKAALAAWILLDSMSHIPEGGILPGYPEGRIEDAWGLGKAMEEALTGSGLDSGAAWEVVTLAGLFRRLGELAFGETAPNPLDEALARLCTDRAVQAFLGVHSHGGDTWFSKERLERLLGFLVTLRHTKGPDNGEEAAPADHVPDDLLSIEALRARAEESEYRWKVFAAHIGAVTPDYSSSHESE